MRGRRAVTAICCVLLLVGSIFTAYLAYLAAAAMIDSVESVDVPIPGAGTTLPMVMGFCPYIAALLINKAIPARAPAVRDDSPRDVAKRRIEEGQRWVAGVFAPIAADAGGARDVPLREAYRRLDKLSYGALHDDIVMLRDPLPRLMEDDGRYRAWKDGIDALRRDGEELARIWEASLRGARVALGSHRDVACVERLGRSLGVDAKVAAWRRGVPVDDVIAM